MPADLPPPWGRGRTRSRRSEVPPGRAPGADGSTGRASSCFASAERLFGARLAGRSCEGSCASSPDALRQAEELVRAGGPSRTPHRSSRLSEQTRSRVCLPRSRAGTSPRSGEGFCTWTLRAVAGRDGSAGFRLQQRADSPGDVPRPGRGGDAGAVRRPGRGWGDALSCFQGKSKRSGRFSSHPPPVR